MARAHATIEEQLQRAQVALDAALGDQDIQFYLTEFGYDIPHIEAGQQLYERAHALYEGQRAQYGEQFVDSDALREAWGQAMESYMRHLRVARVILKQNRTAWHKLGLLGERKQSLSGWMEQARQFYEGALADEEVLAHLSPFGVTRAKLEAGRAEVEAVEATSGRHANVSDEAQGAAESRDHALDQLDEWLDDFLAIAQVALEEQPGLLAKLGASKDAPA